MKKCHALWIAPILMSAAYFASAKNDGSRSMNCGDGLAAIHRLNVLGSGPHTQAGATLQQMVHSLKPRQRKLLDCEITVIKQYQEKAELVYTILRPHLSELLNDLATLSSNEMLWKSNHSQLDSLCKKVFFDNPTLSWLCLSRVDDPRVGCLLALRPDGETCVFPLASIPDEDQAVLPLFGRFLQYNVLAEDYLIMEPGIVFGKPGVSIDNTERCRFLQGWCSKYNPPFGASSPVQKKPT